jgi:HTH-type transcriptional regulator/antitoxin HigA
VRRPWTSGPSEPTTTTAPPSPRSNGFGALAKGSAEGDKLDILVTLVESYEKKRWPIRPRRRFDPVDVLRYAIDELGHTQSELADLVGSRSRASEILARRRALTADMIHKISAAWRIPADLLVQPYALKKRAAA